MNRLLLFMLILIVSCTNNQKKESPMTQRIFDIEGHRGCRGLMPENTIPAFIKAMELGVNTLEMDLIISKDKKVVVSHEPYFKSATNLDPQGNRILKEDELSHNMYQMSYDSIRQYEVGMLTDSNHINRVNISTYRPLFSEVVDRIKTFCEANGQDLPDFNIEIKRVPKYDNLFHPEADEFSDLVLEQVKLHNIESQTIIQSFDMESLQIVKQKAPKLRLALLIENEESPQQNVKNLGFTPEIYSSYFKLVDQNLIEFCKSEGILVIPWTVNENQDITTMIEIGVDGIISDYPDRVIDIYTRHADH